MSDTSPAPRDDDEIVRITTQEVRIRRAPKFGAFILVGALVGFLVTLVLTSLFDADPSVGFVALLAYFSLFGVSIGAALGAVLAIVLDRVGRRRAREARAELTTVEAPPVEGQLED